MGYISGQCGSLGAQISGTRIKVHERQASLIKGKQRNVEFSLVCRTKGGQELSLKHFKQFNF